MKTKTTVTAITATVALAATPLIMNVSPVFGDDADAPSPAPTVLAEDEQAPSNGFIISYKEGTDKAERLAADTAATEGIEALDDNSKANVIEAIDAVDAQITDSRAGAEKTTVVTLDRELDDTEEADFVAKLEADDAVESVEPNLIATPDAVSANDTRFRDQWPLQRTPGGANFQWSWDYTKGEGVTVAVIDTGVTSHYDVYPNLLPGFDFISNPVSAGDGDGRDGNSRDEGEAIRANGCWKGFPARDNESGWHGTGVAGIIGAAMNNGYGITGAAPAAKIQPIRVLGKCGGDAQDIVDGITWASGGEVPGVAANPTPAQIINMSFSARSATCPTYYQRAIDAAVSRGSTVIVSAGNGHTDARNYTPANCRNVIVVGAVSKENRLASYSNFGPKVDVFGPGGDMRYDGGLPTTTFTSVDKPELDTQTVANTHGTSFATPYVSAAAALMKSSNPRLTPAQIRDKLKLANCPVRSCWAGRRNCSAGRLDAAWAVWHAMQ